MNPGNEYTYISTAATTIIGSTTLRRVNLLAILINKTMTGTLTVKSGATTIGTFAIGTPPNSYWLTDAGISIADLQLITTAADDITIAWNNL